ncbi:MAG TPA: hypothetical protein VHT27_05205 [Solirubrobacteraceae bacterium]|nr:hypothetical protein [Solirubrobacteraceae bacterium]
MPRRRSLVAVVMLASCLALPAGARAAGGTLLDGLGAGVSAYGGWAAWTHEDPAATATELMLRSPAGVVAPAPVPAGRGSFEVRLGPRAGGGVAAVYRRCSDPAHLRGCSIYELAVGVAGAAERPLAIPGGGSDTDPAIWKNRVAFVRPRGGSHRHPDGVYVWTIGSRSSPRPATLEASRGGREAGGERWPKGLTGEVTALTIGPRQLAYVTSVANGSFGETTLWYEPIGGRPELIDQETSGAGNVCAPAFLSPVTAGGWLYAYLHACDPSGDPGRDRLTRYAHGEAQRARYVFAAHGDDALGSVVPDGAGVDWDDEGVRRIASVSWQRIPLPVAQTFCTRADPFC